METVQQAVILVGGRGTRLGFLTEHVPKPMLPIAGVPFLRYLLEHIRRFGVFRVVFCSGYLAPHIESYFGDGKRFGFEADYVVEQAPAGTGGALKGAARLLERTFLVLNGDTLFETDLLKLSSLVVAGPEQRLAALALRKVQDSGRYGAVQLEGDRIIDFTEKRGHGFGLISGGVYCLRREALDLLLEVPSSLENDLFPALARTCRLGGFVDNAYFIDIGLPETLSRAERELPGRFSGLLGSSPT